MFTRDLIYHVCPLRGNDIWRLNIEQLLARIDVFNGRRVIAIATCDDEKLHPAEEAMRMFRGHSVQFIKVANDRNLRETASFRPLLDAVETLNPNVVCFYAHTKGNSTVASVEGATYWRNVMYHKLLDEWQYRMSDLAEGHAAVGTHLLSWPKGVRSPYPSRLMHGQWMFAGTFFWFRSQRVFSHDQWHIVPRDRYGTEAYLSGIFEEHQVKCCWKPWPGKGDGRHASMSYEPELYQRLQMCIVDAELRRPMYYI